MKRLLEERVKSKKIKGFIWLIVAIWGTLITTGLLHTPEAIATNAIWALASGGLFLIGGQSLVDSGLGAAVGKRMFKPDEPRKDGE